MLLQTVDQASKRWYVQGKNLAKQNAAPPFEQEKYKTTIKAMTYHKYHQRGAMHMIADKSLESNPGHTGKRSDL